MEERDGIKKFGVQCTSNILRAEGNSILSF